MRSLLLTAALFSVSIAYAAEVFTYGPAQKVGEGYKFTEGPAWHPQEKAFYFSDIPSNNIQRWTAEGGSKLFVDRKSRSNGIVIDPQGRLIFCEIDKRAIVRRAQDGTDRDTPEPDRPRQHDERALHLAGSNQGRMVRNRAHGLQGRARARTNGGNRKLHRPPAGRHGRLDRVARFRA